MDPLLERAVMARLLGQWRSLNAYLFGNALRPPALALSDTQARLGAWERRSRTLSLARRLVAEQPWGVVEEVLKHEMAHQFADEVLGAVESAHGPAFQRVCAERGIDPAGEGLPAALRPESEEDRAMERIRRLLALAGSDNENEAQAAMKAAQRLMLKHNLAHVDSPSNAYTWRHLGTPTGRVQAHAQVLCGIICGHFFVEGVWVPSWDLERQAEGRVFEIMGTPQNVEIAAYVHDFLLNTAERLWRAHRRAAGIRSDKDRRSFLTGVMVGFRTKLEEQAGAHRREGLVWVGDPRLEDYKHRRFPRLRSGGSFTIQKGSAFSSGQDAGRSIVLHRGVGEEARRRGRLLPG